MSRISAFLTIFTIAAIAIVATVNAGAIPVNKIQFDANALQIGVLVNSNALFTFEPEDTIDVLYNADELNELYPSKTKCIYYDLVTQSPMTFELFPKMTIFELFVHHDLELRCGDDFAIKIVPIEDPKIHYTEETIDAIRDEFIQSQDQMREYPSLKSDMVSLSLDTLIGWALSFIKWHWGPLFPFPTWPTDQQSLQSGDVDVGLYHFSGKRLSLAESQKMALDSSLAAHSEKPTSTSMVFGVAADWGSGTEEAFVVTKLLKESGAHYTVNMGDLYLVGSPDDARKNALGIRYDNDTFKTPVEWLSGSLGSFWFQGNHEMYARGIGYFESILPKMGFKDVNGKAKGQKTSYQLMENEHWRIIFLDTGYTTYSTLIHNDDNSFLEPVVDWLKNVVKLGNTADKRGVVILTHHNFMSAFSKRQSVGPAQQLQNLLKDRVIVTIWGHEHKTAIYERSKIGVVNAFPRCAGSSGFPVDHVDIPPTTREAGLVAFDNRPYDIIKGVYGNLTAGYNGFFTMNFTGPYMDISYFTTQWKNDAGKKVLDHNNAHLTMVERFTHDKNGDVEQMAFQIIDPEITQIKNVGTKKSFKKQTMLDDLEDQGRDMETYYEKNKNHRFTQKVGFRPLYDEDATKSALKSYIEATLKATPTTNLEQSKNPLSDIAKLISMGKDSIKSATKVRQMHYSEIQNVEINYDEVVKVDGYSFPKIKF